MDILKFEELSQIWFEQNTVGICYEYATELKSIIKHLNRYFGERNICDIHPVDITTMISELSKNNPNTGKPMSKQMLNVLVKTSYRIFDMAVDNDWIRKNPAKGKTKFIPKNAPKKKVSSISKAEQLAIINTPHRCRTAALIMMFMGLRTNELLALKWKNINFIEKKAYICEHAEKVSPNRYMVMPDTKNRKSRYVTIPDSLCKLLFDEMRKATFEFVFSKTDGTLHTPSSWRSAWRSFMNTVNYYYCIQINGAKFSKNSPKGYPKLIKIDPHQLRHTYATLLYVSGMDVLTGSKLLGHSDVQLTLNTYTHLDEVYKTPDISPLNEYLSSNFSNL